MIVSTITRVMHNRLRFVSAGLWLIIGSARIAFAGDGCRPQPDINDEGRQAVVRQLHWRGEWGEESKKLCQMCWGDVGRNFGMSSSTLRFLMDSFEQSTGVQRQGIVYVLATGCKGQAKLVDIGFRDKLEEMVRSSETFVSTWATLAQGLEDLSANHEQRVEVLTTNREDEEVRWNAFKLLLGHRKGTAAVDLLRAASRDESPAVRRLALMAYGYGDRLSISEYWTAFHSIFLNDPDPELRIAFIDSLPAGSAEFSSAISAGLRDTNPKVRRAAEEFRRLKKNPEAKPH